MSELRSKYGYAFSELVLFKIKAHNSYGWANDFSLANTYGATVRVEP